MTAEAPSVDSVEVPAVEFRELFSAHDPAILQAIKNDIARNGIVEPIVRDEHGRIIDGVLRWEISQELNITCPEVVHAKPVTEDEFLELRIKLNLLHRTVGPVTWARWFEHLARQRGVRLGIRGRQRGKTDTMSLLAEECDVTPRSAERHLKLAHAVEPYPDLAERVDCRELSVKDTMRRVGERDTKRRREAARPPAATNLGDGIDIRLGRFQDVLKDVEDDSVALIVTDPLWQWDEGSLQQYDDLGAFAARVLVPGGGVLVVYGGAAYFGEPIALLRSHGLRGFCSGSLVLTGPTPRVYAIRSIIRSTPIWFFSNGTYKGRWFNNTVKVDGPEKRWHEWQKPLEGFRRYVEVFSEPGDLVVDPFLGGGTAAVAASHLGRRFIGCDSDPLAVESSFRRLQAEAVIAVENSQLDDRQHLRQ